MKKIALLLTAVLFQLLGQYANAQCGLDIYIANDQSGSVDGTENIQGRNFIRQLVQSLNLGNGNTQSRIALAEWSAYGRYSFTSAGLNYSTDVSDIVGYTNAARTINGYTDPYD